MCPDLCNTQNLGHFFLITFLHLLNNFNKTIMRKLILISLFPFLINAQSKTKIYNPKGKWYFGVEIGENRILSNEFYQSADAFFGFSTAYYFDKYWCIQSNLQYYKTEVAYSYNSTFLSNGAKPYQTLFFQGNIISIPVTANWEFKIHKNFKGFLNLGSAFNIETNSNYVVPFVVNPDLSDFPTKYFSLNYGFGFKYYFSKNIAFTFSSIANYGGSKGSYSGFLSSKELVAKNSLNTFGVQYNFNK